MTVQRTSEKLQAWQFTGQAMFGWPAWVQRIAVRTAPTELVIERRSGRQFVYVGEWLLREPDGAVLWCTDRDYRRDYR